MGIIKSTADTVFRDVTAPGSVEPNKVVKGDVREWGGVIDGQMTDLNALFQDLMGAVTAGNLKPYASVVAMTADTGQANGTFAIILSADADKFKIYKWNGAAWVYIVTLDVGSATALINAEQARAQAAEAALQAMVASVRGDSVATVKDSAHKVLLAVKDGAMQVPSSGGAKFLPDMVQLHRVDRSGYPAFKGSADAYPGVINTAAKTRIRDDLSRVIYLVMTWGQSLDGWANDNPADVFLTGDSPWPNNVLMPYLGVRTTGELYGVKPDGQDFTSFVPLRVAPGGNSLQTEKETTLPTALWGVCDYFQSVMPGNVPIFVGMGISRGSRTLEQLLPGNEAGNLFMKACRDAKRATEIQYSGYRVELLCVIHTGDFQARAVGVDLRTCCEHYRALDRAVQVAAKEIFFQAEPAKVILFPADNAVDASGNGVSRAYPHMLAPLKMEGVGNIVVGGPLYSFQTFWSAENSGVHRTSAGYRNLGYLKKQVILKACFGNGFFAHTTEKVVRTAANKYAIYRNCPVPPLTWNPGGLITATPWGYGGLQVFDDGVQVAITGHTFLQDLNIATRPYRIIEITLAAPLAGYSRELRVAMQNNADAVSVSGPAEGARCFLADSQADWPNYAMHEVVSLNGL